MMQLVVVEAIVIGVILAVAGFMMLGYCLKKKEQENTIELMKKQLFPEMEKMTNRMLENTMKVTTESMTKMVKDMQEIQNNF